MHQKNGITARCGIRRFVLAALAVALLLQALFSCSEAKGAHPESKSGSQEARSAELPAKVHSQIALNRTRTSDVKIDPKVLDSKEALIKVLIETADGYKNADLKYVQKNQVREFRLGKFVYANLPKSEINKLEKISSIKRVRPDNEYKPLLDAAVPLISTNSFVSNSFNGSGIRVCVLDTGINKTHPALASRVVAEKDFVTADGDGDNPADFHGHGTHVAGIVASTDSTYRGAAFGSGILNAKVFSSTTGYASTSDILSGIDWCISQGANILTLSLGGEDEQNDGSDALSQYVDLAADQGKVVTIAAGNSGPSGNAHCRTGRDSTGSSYSICAPGLSRKGITVGSTQTNKSITTDGLSGFSSRGPTSDLRIKPDVAAPGEWITSANAGYLSGALWTTLGGTSMATPMVAGLSALILQARTMSPEEVKTLLMNTAVDLGSLGKDNSYGAGRVNASRVFDEINNTARNTVDNTGYKIHNIFVPSGSKEIRATLYWPETYSSHNDVDLYLLDPAGTISASSSSSDNTDEMIKLSNPSPAGNWKLLVDPFSVNGNQVYSLASNFKPSEQMYLGTGNISDKIAYHRINVTDSSKKLIANLDWNFTNANLDIYLYNTSGHLVNQSLAINTNYEEVSANVPESGTWLVRIVPSNLGVHTEIPYSLSSTFGISQQILDNMAPNVTLIEPIDKTYNAQNINLTFRVIENLNTLVDCYRHLDNTTDFLYPIQTDYLSTHDFSVSDGTHGISVTCVDTANNSGNSPLIYFTVDTASPGVTPTLPVTGANLSTANVTFNFTVTDASPSVSCNLFVDGAINKTFSAITNGSNAVHATNDFPDGNYNWSVSCRDGAGNVNDSMVARDFTVDTTAPAISLNLPVDNFSTASANNVTFNWTATDTLSLPILCNLTIDGTLDKSDLPVENGTRYNTTATTSDFADGSHIWSVSCRDSLGNTNSTIPAQNFTVDTTAPGVTPTLPVTGANLSTANVTFNFTVTDASPSVSCNLFVDGAINKTFSAITNGSNAVHATNDFPDGNYNWSVSCRDGAGNVNDSMVARDFTVDTTAPAISLNLPVDNFSTASANNVTFNWTATDTLSVPIGCNLTIDGAVNKLDLLVENGIFTTTSEFADGAHTWSVSCQDSLGNTNNTIHARDFTVDTIPPSISYAKITPKSAKPNSNVTLIAAIDDSSNINNAYLVVYNSSWTEVIPQQNLSKSGNDWFLTFNISSSPAGIYYFNITATDTSNKATAWVGNLSVDGTSGAANTFTNDSVSAPDNQTLINAIHDTNVSLQIKTNQSVSTSAVVAISSYTENPGDANTGVPALNKYLDITTSSDIGSALSWAIIKVYYDDSDIPSGYSENNLRLYYFNETSRSWDEYDGSLIGGVNTTGNYVWANTTHFSIYGVFIIPTCNDGIQNQGESGADCGGPYCSACYSPPSNPSSVSGGSSGGGGSGSDFKYIPVLRGKLSIFGYPAYMNAEQGKQVSHTFTIENIGNATLHDVGLAISGMNPSWFSLVPGTVSELKADEVQLFTLTVRLPANTAPKKYSLTLNATSSDDGVPVVSSMVFEVLEKAKAKSTPIADVNNSVTVVEHSGNKVQDTPAPTTPGDANPLRMDEAGLFLIGGGGLLFWRATIRRRKMHKLHDETHLMAVRNSSSASGKKQQ